ncbi:NUDIX domain-containing protein [Paenibacillus woosongensis]|uniref:NUDIX domain-containing protein n=1 Tax=Paenibacillus woosongensis TaxID=307580 RepID=A0AA95KV95_9BACL|nr:NUDIX domain-containing protein [Paenibacillus woosongensis]WHX50933.1 NUDIX domain-containing protein [Paenibacillus woosongensis]
MFFVNARAFIERIRNNRLQLVIQTRNKAGELELLELPGGRLELFEPILEGLKREVFEETGLKVTQVDGEETRIDTKGINHSFEVECIRPFCVYQTVKGPIDSTGMYFICSSEGELLEAGDDTKRVHWRDIEEIKEMLEENPLYFSDVDRAGLIYYFKHRFFSGAADS